jgi:tetratricopeptide (TPR) repeat protein
VGFVRFVGFVGFALVLGDALSAQSRRIQGTVVDEHGQPVAAAAIEVTVAPVAEVDSFRVTANQTWRSETNAAGEYFITVPNSGTYIVNAAKTGIGRDQARVAVQRSGLAVANLTLLKPAAVTVAEGRCGGGDFAAAIARVGLEAAAADPGLARFLMWLEAVRLHAPGCGDPPAIEIGRWGTRNLEELMRDVRELARFLQRSEEERAKYGGNSSPQAALAIYGRRFSLEHLERRYNDSHTMLANNLLLRGAVLHADIGIFVPGTLSHYPLVEDGGRKGWREGSWHWEVGRLLLDNIAPSVRADSRALLWYRAVSAHLFRSGNLAQVGTHLTRAREALPQSAEILIDSAYLHQELSSPAVQGSLQELRDNSINVTVDSRRGELQRADRFFREALALTPGDADARIRLGHTLVELGRHKEAAVELHKAINGKPDARRLYLAELFLGRAEHALGRHAEARRLYEHAAELYPNAQSPKLALSHVARQTGDRFGAQQSLNRLIAAPTATPSDPWWFYYQPHRDDADALMNRMREIGVPR